MLEDFAQEKDTICTVIFTKRYEEVAIDFTIKCSIFGEVFQVDNHFLQLPADAQKLMFKGITKEVINEIKHDVKLFPFLVPLAVMGYMEGEEWSKFSTTIAKKIEQIPTLKKLVLTEHIKEDWVKEAWAWHRDESKKHWLNLFCDIYNEKELIFTNSQWISINTTASPFTDSFFFAILPKLENENRAGAVYRHLSKFLNEKQLDFLLLNLKNNNYEKYHAFIISALGKYKLPKIREAFLAYYHKNQLFKENVEVPESLVHGIGQFPDEEVKSILFSFLLKKEVARISYKELLSFGVSQQEIAVYLDPILKSNPSLEVLDALVWVYYWLDPQWRPPFSTILDIGKLMWKEDKGIDNRFPRLFRDKDHDIAIQLELLSNHEDIKIRKGAIRCYYETQNSEDIYKIVAALVSKNQIFFETIFLMLQNRFKFYPDKKWVNVLLNSRSSIIYDKDRNLFFRTLSGLIKKSAFEDSAIVPILIEEFHKEGKSRQSYTYNKYSAYIDIIEILEPYGDEEEAVTNLLLKAMNHSLSEVKNRAIKALGSLSHHDFSEILEDVLKNGNYNQKSKALQGLKPRVLYNKILYKNLIPYNQHNASAIWKIFDKLFPHPDSIPILEKYLKETTNPSIEYSAVLALLKIPEFLRSPAFKTLLKSENDEIKNALKLRILELMGNDLYDKIFNELMKDDKEMEELIKNFLPLKRNRNRPKRPKI